MYIRGEKIDEIPHTTYSFKETVRTTAKDAVVWLKKISYEIDKNSPLHYNEIIINDRISLWIPGKYSYKYPGDYLLTWDGKPPSHKDVCDAILKTFDREDNILEKYKNWIQLLEDVYYNGTTNLQDCEDDRERFIKELIFWVTLQEDINRSEKLGRLTPFCRYAEAVATVLPGTKHDYESVIKRLDSSDPFLLGKFDLPLEPKYYKWSAF